MASKDKGQAAAVSGCTEVTLVRGTFTDIGEGGAPVTFGPGKTVKVTAEDKAMLERLGFIHGSDYVAPDEVQDGTLKISAAEGPSVTSIGAA